MARLVLFMVLAVATAPPSAPSEPAVAASPIDNVRLKQLDELITYLGVLPQPDSEAELSSAMYTRLVAPADPTWTPSDPRWIAVHDQINKDLKRDLGPAQAAAERAIRQLWEKHLSTELSTPQLQYLLAFYGSPLGVRYRALQHALEQAQTSAVAELLEQLPPPAPATSKINPELQAASARASALSLAATLGKENTAPPASATSTGSTSHDPLLNERFALAFAKLEAQYKEDLDAFLIFNQSPAIASVHKAALAVNNELPNIGEYQQLFTLYFLEPQKRMADWQAARVTSTDRSSGAAK